MPNPFYMLAFTLLSLALGLGPTLTAVAENISFMNASADSFAHPHDLTLDSEGKYLYVADMNHDTIKILDPQSLEVIGAFGDDELNSPHDVEFDTSGRLIVADSGNHRLVVYEVNGLNAQIVKMVTNQLRSPEGIAVYKNGDWYVANTAAHNIVHLQGAVIKQTGTSGRGEAEFIRPHDLEFLDDRLYVTDPGNDRIKILSPDLNILQILGGEAYGFDEPKYLALDEIGRLYVADQYNNRIQVFAEHPNHNKLLASITSYTIDGENTRLNKPEGVEVRGEWIWISDTYNDRILLYRWNE